MRSSGIFAIVSLATALAIPAAGRAQTVPSPNFQINAAHTGALITMPKFTPPLKKRWSVDLGGNVSYPIVADGMIFVTVSNVSAYGSQLFALNAATGKTIWKKAISGTYFSSFGAYDNGTIYNLNFNGVLQSFVGKTGAPNWSVQLPVQYSFEAPPVALGGKVFVVGAGEGGTVYTVDGKTGAVQRQISINVGTGVPAVANGELVANAGCDTYGFDIRTGATLWHDNGDDCSGGVGGNAALFGSKAFVTWFNGSADGALLNRSTGALDFTLINATPAIFGNAMVQAQGSLTATNLTTGNTLWTISPSDGFSVPPIVVNAVVYAVSNNGNLYALDLHSGTQLQEIALGNGPNGSEGAAVPPGLGAAPGLIVVPTVSRLTALGE